MSDALSLRWYALRVKSNCERVVSSALRHKGHEIYLPTYHASGGLTERQRLAERLLFKGYVFCRLDPAIRLPVLVTPGIVHILGIGKTPVAIPDEEIEAVRAVVHSGLPAMPWRFLQVGDWVLVERGPLAGLEGILVNLRGAHRLVVSISILQRSVAAEIDGEWVRPIRKSPSRLTATAGALGRSA